ncbi:MAG: TonB-dependent receptor [Candidatus Kapaibacterium sp.]|nr:MAG: TonB-dependent receptor [Candidatus Kapabacteria bacterium]
MNTTTFSQHTASFVQFQRCFLLQASCFLVFALLCAVFPSPSFAKCSSLLDSLEHSLEKNPSKTKTDSTRPKPASKLVRLTPLDVVANRISSSNERRTAPITTLDAAQIQGLGARQAADALSFVPGVFVRNYGGVGGLKSLSLRGANASQTLVLLDGVRVNSSQNGQFDAASLPASMLEELEVVRGGAGAMLGAGAMAGAINLRTKTSLRAPELAAQGEIASFEEFRAMLSGGIPLGRFAETQGNIGIWGHAEWQRGQGNYPFRFNEFGRDTTLQRMNADATFVNASLAGFAQFKQWKLQSRIMTRFSERGTPGAVVQGSVEMARARLREQEWLATFSAHHAFTEQSLFTAQGSCRFGDIVYLDPDARQFGANGINERFLSEDWSGMAKLLFQESVRAPFRAVQHEWLLEGTQSVLQGNMFQRGVGNRVRRTGIGVAAKGEARIALGNTFVNTFVNTPEISMNAAFRVDDFSDVGGAVSPLLGSALLLDSSLTVRAQWSYNFRPPSFNELYYLNFGNAALKPERAECWNVGADFRPLFASNPLNAAPILAFTIDGFAHFTRNQILAVQNSPFTVSAQNIEQVRTLGVEASFRAVLGNSLSSSWSFLGQYTFQRVENVTPQSFVEGKQLVYTPQHLASGSLRYEKEWFSASLNAQYAGERFSLPANTADSRLAPFLVVNILAEAKYALASLAPVFGGTSVTMRLLCDNCLNESYTVIRNFPMPTRAFRASLLLRWN